MDISHSAPPSRWRVDRFPGSGPWRFYSFARTVVKGCLLAAFMFAAAGLYIGLFAAPAEPAHGEAGRIAFLHLPAVSLAMLLYLAMALLAAAGVAFDSRLASMLACAIAPTGALMSLLALATGALWSQAVRGEAWVWDARLASEITLLLVYAGIVALHAAIGDPHRADRAAGLLAVVGALNLPVMYFSAPWWQAWHRGDEAVPLVAGGLLLMALAFSAYAMAAVLARVRLVIVERERRALLEEAA